MTTKYVNSNGNGSHRTVYHIDPNCKRLKNGNYREASENLVEWHDLDLCEFCKEGTDPSNPYE